MLSFSLIDQTTISVTFMCRNKCGKMNSFEEGPFATAINTFYLRCGQTTHSLTIKVSLERNTNRGTTLTMGWDLLTYLCLRPLPGYRPSTRDRQSSWSYFMGLENNQTWLEFFCCHETGKKFQVVKFGGDTASNPWMMRDSGKIICICSVLSGHIEFNATSEKFRVPNLAIMVENLRHHQDGIFNM